MKKELYMNNNECQIEQMSIQEELAKNQIEELFTDAEVSVSLNTIDVE